MTDCVFTELESPMSRASLANNSSQSGIAKRLESLEIGRFSEFNEIKRRKRDEVSETTDEFIMISTSSVPKEEKKRRKGGRRGKGMKRLKRNSPSAERRQIARKKVLFDESPSRSTVFKGKRTRHDILKDYDEYKLSETFSSFCKLLFPIVSQD